jgi:hypothetical protein
MARGGYRPGSGRPHKEPTPKVKPARLAVIPAGDEIEAPAALTPLEYMLAVMNSPEADRGRRDRMAVAAAPYVHVRAADVEGGKKEQRQAVADDAAQPGNRYAPPAAPKLVVSNKKPSNPVE